MTLHCNYFDITDGIIVKEIFREVNKFDLNLNATKTGSAYLKV